MELLGISRRTLSRWIRRGLLTPRLQYVGGTHLRFLFLCGEIVKFIDDMPTPRTLTDKKMLRLLDQRRAHIKKAAAARMAKKMRVNGEKASGEEAFIVDQKPRRQRNRQEGKGGADEWSPWSSREDEGEEER